ncbi:MAG: ACP S-malonyltransferase [Butyrivibrio sp.]|nr:ACP S-malonyltransferase [Butyrivibrio sp.]MBP3195531.1 ACP S-malonyltransferase [Butyrivibrio sp.]
MSKVTVVFPGQGKKFGKTELLLMERHTDIVEKAENVLGFSPISLLMDRPEEIKRTEYAQPMGYLTAYLFYEELISKLGKKPDFVIGHSLGELCALTAGEYIDFEEGLILVNKRGRIMAKAGEGGMTAVMGKNPEKILDAIEDEISGDIDIANYNSPFQIVISGPEDSLNEAEERLSERGLKAVRLSVSGAFHSRYMNAAAEEFNKELNSFPFERGGEVKVMSSVRPVFYGENPLDILREQITSPVRFTESINEIIDQGCYDFIQVDGGLGMINLVDEIKFDRALNSRNY